MSRSITGIQHRTVILHEAEQAIEFTFRGHLTEAECARTLQFADDLLREAPHPVHTSIWTALEHESHGPETPAMAIRWQMRHQETIRHSIMVARKASLFRLVGVTRVMVPGLDADAVTTREEALAAAAGFAAQASVTPLRRPGRRQVG